jgi:hypothetical protein
VTETHRHHGASKLRKRHRLGTQIADVISSLAIRLNGQESLTMAEAISP